MAKFVNAPPPEPPMLEQVQFICNRGVEHGSYSRSGNSTPNEVARFLNRALASSGFPTLKVMVEP